MKFFWGDYHKATRHLTRDQHGAYFLLLGEAWRLGGSLPDDDHMLSAWALCTPAEWSAMKATVMGFFSLRRSKWVHDRVREERASYETTSRKRKEAGKRGGMVSCGKTTENSQAIAYQLPTKPEPEPEENIDTPLAPKGAVDGGKPKITLRQADVEAVWSIAPPKARERSSRADVLKALQGAARRGNHPAEVMVGVSAYYASREATRNDGEYAKGIHRVIIADRWKDFIPAGGMKTQTDPSNWPHERWRVVLDRYKVTGKWPENAGPSPENEGSFVPDMLKGPMERAA
jgi:uncharacterized protein YdaU (DUF1376 family)